MIEESPIGLKIDKHHESASFHNRFTSIVPRQRQFSMPVSKRDQNVMHKRGISNEPCNI